MRVANGMDIIICSLDQYPLIFYLLAQIVPFSGLKKEWTKIIGKETRECKLENIWLISGDF